jgi:hypothetical protein
MSIVVGLFLTTVPVFASVPEKDFDTQNPVVTNNTPIIEDKSLSESDVILTAENVKLTKSEAKEYESFKDGLVDELCQASPENYSKIIVAYYQNNENVLSEKIDECIDERTAVDSPVIAVDNSLDEKYGATFVIDENTSIVITPKFLYLDVIEINDIIKSTQSEATSVSQSIKDMIFVEAYAASTKYISVATRRTAFLTVAGNSIELASVHTGGEIAYNGSKATHSSGNYAYYERALPNVTVGQVQTWNEAYSGTSWHYKMLGVVSGKITIVGTTITVPSTAISCEVIVSKTGDVTKKYVPAL